MHAMFGMKMHARFKAHGKRTFHDPGALTAWLGYLALMLLSGMSLTAGDWVGGILLTIASVAIVFGP